MFTIVELTQEERRVCVHTRGAGTRRVCNARAHGQLSDTHTLASDTRTRSIYNFFCRPSLVLSSFSLAFSHSLPRVLALFLFLSLYFFSRSLFLALPRSFLPRACSLSLVLVSRKHDSSFSFSFETCQRPPGHALHPRRPPASSCCPRPSRTILAQPPLFISRLLPRNIRTSLDRPARFFALSRFCKNMRTLIRRANSFSGVDQCTAYPFYPF